MTRSAAVPAGFLACALLALGLLCGLPAPANAQTPTSEQAKATNCAPAGGASFICGVSSVEDFAPVPHTRWVIGSDLAPPNTQGTLYLFDTGIRKAKAVDPASITVKQDDKTYPECPARRTSTCSGRTGST